MDKLPHSIETQFSKQIQQAMQMEREQIEEAFNVYGTYEEAGEYYNEMYGVKVRENKPFMSEEEWVKEYTGEKGRDIGGSEYGDYR
jgi:hypothetical protein